MGLDITAYKGLELFPTTKDRYDHKYLDLTTGLDEENIIEIYNEHQFTDRAQPFPDRSIYRFKERKHFFVISYSGYHYWRNQLARIAGYSEDGSREIHLQNEKPFYELINFTKYQGTVGTNAIKKLLDDFNRQVIPSDIDEDFKLRYQQIWDAFEFAKEDGLVSFH
jgi:hypothetical protein